MVAPASTTDEAGTAEETNFTAYKASPPPHPSRTGFLDGLGVLETSFACIGYLSALSKLFPGTCTTPKQIESVHLHRYDPRGNVVHHLSLDYRLASSDQKADLKTTITEYDENSAYQIVTLNSPPGSETPYTDMYPSWLVETLSIGLDLEPRIWAYMKSRSPRWTQQEDWQALCRLHAWLDITNFIDLGKDAMLVLDSVAGKRPKTALLFLTTSAATDLSALFALMPPPVTSVIRDPHAFIEESDKTFLLHQWVQKQSGAQHDMGLPVGDFIYIFLEGLLRYHISIPPCGAGITQHWDGPFRPKYRGSSKSHSDPQELWYHLRREVDDKRSVMLKLRRFVSANFADFEGELSQQYNILEADYKRHIEAIEMEEAMLKDQINILMSGKSTEMAELSIQESKRVMLLTCLAFIFLPLSLSTSIYGMNVQQINRTGHDIRAVLVTSAGLFLFAIVLWGSVSSVIRYRKARIEQLNAAAQLGCVKTERQIVDIFIRASPKNTRCASQRSYSWWWPRWRQDGLESAATDKV